MIQLSNGPLVPYHVILENFYLQLLPILALRQVLVKKISRATVSEKKNIVYSKCFILVSDDCINFCMPTVIPT